MHEEREREREVKYAEDEGREGRAKKGITTGGGDGCYGCEPAMHASRLVESRGDG